MNETTQKTGYCVYDVFNKKYLMHFNYEWTPNKTLAWIIYSYQEAREIRAKLIKEGKGLPNQFQLKLFVTRED